MYRDHRKGPGGPPSGATCPRRLRGPSVGGDQPLGGLVRPPQGGQGARESGRGRTLVQMGLKAHLVGASPLSPLGRLPKPHLGLAAPLGVGNPKGGAAPPSPYIYLRHWSIPTDENLSLLAQPYLSPFSSPTVLGEALQDCHAPPSPPRRCAAAGWSLPQPLPLSLLDQGMGDVTGLYVC